MDVIVSVVLGEKHKEIRSARTNPEAATVAEMRFPLSVTKSPPQNAPPRYPATGMQILAICFVLDFSW